MTTSEEYEEQSDQCMVWAGNSAEQQRTLDAQLNAMGGIQQALLAAVVELRRLNEGRDQWYREVLEVLTQAKDGDGSPVGSEQPEAAPDCWVCGRVAAGPECQSGELTTAQWTAHSNALYGQRRRAGATTTQAQAFADDWMAERFGPCPEES